jgi:hypothetical protein
MGSWDKFFRKGLGLSYKVKFMNGSKIQLKLGNVFGFVVVISYEICSFDNDKLVPRPLNL